MKKSTEMAVRDVESQDWYVVDAEGKTLGRLCSKVAAVLRGKHKPSYTPNADVGDFVIVLNAEKIRLTGKKMTDKMYYRHTGYMGGLKAATPEKLLEKHPTRIVEYAVRGMLPKTRLGDRLFTKLKVYAGSEHPHQAQQPKPLVVTE